MKNVIFWTGIKNNSPNMVEKYGGYDWMDISKKSWEYWCKKNDCIFYHYDNPSQKDLIEYRVTWQRWFDVYDELEKNNIDYNKIFVVDACSIVKWDCPNFFELTDDRMTAWLDKDNWGWIYQSVVGYKDFFGPVGKSSREIVNNYINAGAVIINKNHKEFFKSLKEFYYDNKEKLISLQDKEVLKGTDQTPFNYWLQFKNIDVNTSLPFMYNLTHMHRKSMLMYNWQLDEDKTPYFIKWGYVWKFNGIPKNERTNLMTQTWNLVKDYYVNKEDVNIDFVLENTPDKKIDNNTTSKKFKKDLYKYVSDNLDSKNMTALEVGTAHGYTTAVLGLLFKKVDTMDYNIENIDKADAFTRDICKLSNVNCHLGDTYIQKWPESDFNFVLVDCMHALPMVIYDIYQVLRKSVGKKVTVVFDDYGLDWGENAKQVKHVVDWFIKLGYLKFVKKIGHKKGTQVQNSFETILGDSEGIICESTDKSVSKFGNYNIEYIYHDDGTSKCDFQFDSAAQKFVKSIFTDWEEKYGELNYGK